MSREFSKGDIDLGMRLQNLEHVPVIGAAYRFGRWAWTGSDSPSHVYLRWQRVREAYRQDGNGGQLIETSPNHDAGLSPRSYKRAAVFAAGAAAIGDIYDVHGYHGLPVLAYEYEEEIYAGALPRRKFGKLNASDAEHERTLMAAAERQGRSALVGGIGILYPEKETLIIPADMHMADELVHTRDMAARYPGVPMA